MDSVNLDDILASQKQLEAEAAEAIPYSFSSCTFAGIQDDRQPLFSCLSCRPQPLDPNDRAGICAACSVSCHGSCNLVELFSRRGFTCDCGTTRLGAKRCELTMRNLDTPAADNHYDDNFDGIFCACKREYDPENEVDEMIQCLVCQDWFHTERCISNATANTDSSLDTELFEHLVCANCVEGEAAQTVGKYAGSPCFLILGNDNKLATNDKHYSINLNICREANAAIPDTQVGTCKRPRSPSANADDDGKRVKLAKVDGECTAPPIPRRPMMATNVFLTEGWQDKWCRCDKCLPLYEKMPYLLYGETVYVPPLDPDAGKSLDELGTAALMNMPREQAIRSVEAYQGMRDKLKAFLQPFASEGKVVAEADIKQFFEDQKIA